MFLNIKLFPSWEILKKDACQVREDVLRGAKEMHGMMNEWWMDGWMGGWMGGFELMNRLIDQWTEETFTPRTSRQGYFVT